MQTYQIAPEKVGSIAPLITLLKATGYAAEFDGVKLTTDAPYAVLNNQLPPVITEKMVRDLVRAAFKGENYTAPGLSSVLWPLDLRKLLDAPEPHFAHDVFGIRRYLDRTTGKLRGFFNPRCSLPE